MTNNEPKGPRRALMTEGEIVHPLCLIRSLPTGDILGAFKQRLSPSEAMRSVRSSPAAFDVTDTAKSVPRVCLECAKSALSNAFMS